VAGATLRAVLAFKNCGGTCRGSGSRMNRSKRRREEAVIAGIGVVSLAVGGVVAIMGGSSDVAWPLVAMGCGILVFALAEALGLGKWVVSSPMRRRVYLGASVAILACGVSAYLVWDTPALWWIAPLAALPLYLLLIWEPEDPRRGGAGDFTGPWTPPDGGGP
jgi:hypothetical protein